MWLSLSLIPVLAITLKKIECQIRQKRLKEDEDLDKAYFAPQPRFREQYGY